MDKIKSSFTSSKRRDRETSTSKSSDKLSKEMTKINKDIAKSSLKRDRSPSPKETRKRIKRSTSDERINRLESPLRQRVSPKPKKKRNSTSESITLNNKKSQDKFSNKYESITDNDEIDNKKLHNISTLDWPNLLTSNSLRYKKNSILQFYNPVTVLAKVGVSQNYFETETIRYLNKISSKKSSKQETKVKEISLFGVSKELEYRKKIFSQSRDLDFQIKDKEKQNANLSRYFELIKSYNI
jgi:hypothetical protein